jgi:hypothetical protein
VVEIGERLMACRAILKDKRAWLAWLKAEFRWSRRHADRFIAVAKNKGNCATLRTLGLPISALYELATASRKLIAKIEQDIEAGERPSVRDIQQQARAERPAISLTSSSAPSSPRPMIALTASPQQPTPRRIVTGGDFHRISALSFAQQLAQFAHSLTGDEPAAVAKALPAEKREEVLADTEVITTFLNELRRALWERGKPRLVSDEGESAPGA